MIDRGCVILQKERSCGGVVYTKINNEIYYVIIESITGSYGFPKGHIEKGETEEETALREIKEEVGLNVKLDNSFCMVDKYRLYKNNKMKKVVYFIGEFENQKIKYQKEELNGAYLLKYEDAYDLLKYERLKEILKKANKKIKKDTIN